MTATATETDALIVARKIETSAIIARRGLATGTGPAIQGDGAALELRWEGRVFRVTVEDLGPEPDEED